MPRYREIERKIYIDTLSLASVEGMSANVSDHRVTQLAMTIIARVDLTIRYQ